jgi:hypothetical protein
LGAHGFPPPPKAVVLLELPKAPLDDLAAWLIKRARPRFWQGGFQCARGTDAVKVAVKPDLQSKLGA